MRCALDAIKLGHTGETASFKRSEKLRDDLMSATDAEMDTLLAAFPAEDAAEIADLGGVFGWEGGKQCIHFGIGGAHEVIPQFLGTLEAGGFPRVSKFDGVQRVTHGLRIRLFAHQASDVLHLSAAAFM